MAVCRNDTGADPLAVRRFVAVDSRGRDRRCRVDVVRVEKPMAADKMAMSDPYIIYSNSAGAAAASHIRKLAGGG